MLIILAAVVLVVVIALAVSGSVRRWGRNEGESNDRNE
jgi:hypothetical protein